MYRLPYVALKRLVCNWFPNVMLLNHTKIKNKKQRTNKKTLVHIVGRKATSVLESVESHHKAMSEGEIVEETG